MRTVLIKICPHYSNRQAMHCARDIGKKKLSPEALGNFLFKIASNDLYASRHPSNAPQPALWRTPPWERKDSPAEHNSGSPYSAYSSSCSCSDASDQQELSAKEKPHSAWSNTQVMEKSFLYPSTEHPKLCTEF